MEEVLRMYFGININTSEDNIFKFIYNKNNYIFIRKQNIDLDFLNYLFNFNYLNKPILNLYDQYITFYNNNYYLLFYDDNNLINRNDLINFLNQKYEIVDNKIKEKWCKKVDYHEYQITQFGYKYKLLRESINYVVGLSEIGIQLLNTINFEYCYSCFVHNRINNKLFDFKNPLEIIYDYRIRDISEYIKYNFFYENKEIFNELVFNLNLTKEEYKLLFARLLFITPYYDLYEEIIDNKIEENEIKKIILKLNDYEKFLKKIYLTLKRYTDIDIIELFNN